jgi:hypothetical protein
VGDRACASNFVQGEPRNILIIDGQEFDQLLLIKQLEALRTVLENQQSSGGLELKDESYRAILEAEEEARKGNAAGVKGSLERVGKWVLQLASATSCSVAAAAINHALGLQ